MNSKHFKEFYKLMLNEIQLTRDAGQEEYAHTKSNVFANFERIGSSIDAHRDKVLMVYLLKHIDGINAFVKGHTSQREDVTGRIKDAIVYLLLLWGMVEEDKLGDVDYADR